MQSDYTFNNLGRIGYDNTDNSQRNIQNKQYSDWVFDNHFSNNTSDSHVQFSSSQPGIYYSNSSGNGINSNVVDNETRMLRQEQQRPLEKLQLFSRPFITVPYLGRGSCDPVLESQLFFGETVRGKKSVSTIMDKTFDTAYPGSLKEHEIENLALGGWGGEDTRESGDKYFRQNARPNDSF